MLENNSNNHVDWTIYTKKIWLKCGILAFIVVFLLLFKTLFDIILLILASALIAIYFYGFAGLVKRYLHLSSKISLIISVVFNLMLLVAFFWFVGARFQSQIYELTDILPGTIQQAKEQLGKSSLGSKALDYIDSTGSAKKTSAFIGRFFSSSFGILSDLYLVVLMSIFFIASPGVYKRGLVHLLPEKAKDKGDELMDQLGYVLKKWLKGQIIGFFFIAIFTGMGLLILGLPLVFTLALIAGLLNFIPNFGPIIAVVPAMLLALTQGPTTVLLVFGMYTLIQIIQSAVTQPLIQKKMISMPPVLTVVAQVDMGALSMTLVNELYVNKQTYHKYPIDEA
jgi:predicted PurR-regulated permease PerM